jgi:hypothetical protein
LIPSRNDKDDLVHADLGQDSTTTCRSSFLSITASRHFDQFRLFAESPDTGHCGIKFDGIPDSFHFPAYLMNDALERIAKEVNLASPASERLRLEFGYACVQRVAHLLEETAAIECFQSLGRYLDGTSDHAALARNAAEANRLASQHQGSKSIDGCGHAAVSATYALANALAGKGLQAAEYAAYASVYGQGGYGAVAERESFEPEFSWQVSLLTTLAHRCATAYE